MRTRFTGVGTALITPFTRIRRGGRGRRAAAGAAPDRRAARTSWCRAAPPAKCRRSAPTSGGASSSWSSTKPPAKTPVLAGAGGYDTREVAHAAAEMHAAGADGLLSVTPYYNRPTPEGLFQHYPAIADATPLPIVVYNVPGRTGCNVDAADAGPPGHDSQRRRREGSRRQHDADGRDRQRRARGLPGAVGRRRADACR